MAGPTVTGNNSGTSTSFPPADTQPPTHHIPDGVLSQSSLQNVLRNTFRPRRNGRKNIDKASMACSATDSDPLATKWAGIIIHPDIFGCHPLKDPTSLEAHLDLCMVDFDSNGAVQPQSFLDLIGSGTAPCFTNAYHRDAEIDDWYYAFYSNPDSPCSKPNVIADIVKPAGHPPICGAVLVVLNGPSDGLWEVAQRMDTQELARTLWWYHKSGCDVAEVFGEREFQRYLRLHLA